MNHIQHIQTGVKISLNELDIENASGVAFTAMRMAPANKGREKKLEEGDDFFYDLKAMKDFNCLDSPFSEEELLFLFVLSEKLTRENRTEDEIALIKKLAKLYYVNYGKEIVNEPK